MADLSQITIIGPYEAQFNTTPENLQPSECQAPPEIPGTFVLDPINPPDIPTECTYLFPPVVPIPFNPFAATPTPSVVSLPFRLEAFSGLTGRVPGGRVEDKGQNCDVPDEYIPIPASSSNYIIWLEKDTNTGDNGADCNCWFINSGVGGWVGYPEQPDPPKVKYIELARPITNVSTITDFGLVWHGGDMTRQVTEKIPFRCMTECGCDNDTDPGCNVRVLVPGGRVIKADVNIDLPDDTVDIPYDETDHIIWLEMDDETLPSPTITVEHSSTGWAGYPNQPNSPLTKYFELAKVDTSAVIAEGITAIKLKWQGGDIIWPVVSSSTIKPFTLVLTKNDDPDPNYTLRVIPGVVNQLLPVSILTTYTYVPLSVVFVYLSVITDGRSIISSTLVYSATDPAQGIDSTQSTPPITFNILLGIVLNNAPYQVWTGGNISVNASLTHVEDRSPIVIGSSPTIKWYTWLPTGLP